MMHSPKRFVSCLISLHRQDTLNIGLAKTNRTIFGVDFDRRTFFDIPWRQYMAAIGKLDQKVRPHLKRRTRRQHRETEPYPPKQYSLHISSLHQSCMLRLDIAK